MKKRSLRVGLFGISLCSVNYGVTALGISQIIMLEKISQKLGIALEYCIFSDENIDDICSLDGYLPLNKLSLKYIVRFRTGLKGLNRLRRDIQKCDLIIDLTYGDSFSDIYGFKGFLLYSIPKLVAIKCKKILVLGPQTIGPFYGRLTKRIAKYIIDSATYIVVRDEKSLGCCQEMARPRDVVLASDLAMELPFDVGGDAMKHHGKKNVGLNVSLMLWNKSDEFNFKFNYRHFSERLIEVLLQKNVNIHLIAHVYDSSPHNEYWLAEELYKKYPNTIIAPCFCNPIEAKNYLCQLDFFVGARMHATIGAFSSGVPVVPISYSRKFEGLYSAIGYPYTVNCKEHTEDEALDIILHMLDKASFYKKEQTEALYKARKMNQKYSVLLERIINNS